MLPFLFPVSANATTQRQPILPQSTSAVHLMPSAPKPQAVNGSKQGPWNSLEVAKLIVSAFTPIAVALLGVYLTRLAKRFEHLQWRNQRLVEKRIAVYDALAPDLNDLLCYYTFVGCWKDLTPPAVIALKRNMDKRIYLAAPLFPPVFFEACTQFMNLCFATFQGWGRDARLKTPPDRRRGAGAVQWDASWEDCFAPEISDPKDIRASYQRIMSIFAQEIGLAPESGQSLGPVGRYPSNITRKSAG